MDDTEKTLTSLFTHARYVAAATALAVLWTMETVAPMFVGRTRRASHNAANLALAALNAGVALLFAGAMLFATETARAHHFGLLALASPPEWLRWVLAILVFDCWQYWWHRLNHRVPLFWRFHAVHHADAEMDASSGVRFHTGEIVLSFGVRLAVLPLLGLNLLELLAYETLALPVILFHHSNLRLSRRADRALRWLIVTPWMHVVHHSRWQPETDSNFASFLSVWDRLFGSFRLRDKPHEIALGLDDWHERDWRSLPGMLTAPFRKRPAAGPAAGPSQPDGK